MLDFSSSLTCLSEIEIPAEIDFKIAFEKSRAPSKKYAINADSGMVLDTVGKDFTCVSHGDFFRNILKTVSDNLEPSDIENAKPVWNTGRNGGFAMLDLRLPDMKTTIYSENITTEIGNRIIALHGVDGLCSNQTHFGAIDFFCTNGMVTGKHTNVKKKNTKGFSLEAFISELKRTRSVFYDETAKFQEWSNTSLKGIDVKSLLNDILSSERKAQKMFDLFNSEIIDRGCNKFALYSAFTNFASFADERNGFKIRETGSDHKTLTMWQRELDVNKWIEHDSFTQIGVAA